MIFERITANNSFGSQVFVSATSTPTMLRSASPIAAMRNCISPANSEISVGSPSPPPIAAATSLTSFRPINAKRLRLSPTSSAHDSTAQQSTSTTPPESTRRKSAVAERMKSFSIADILGKKEVPSEVNHAALRICAPAPPLAISLPQSLHERLSAPLQSASNLLLEVPPLAAAPTSALSKTLRPWDPASIPPASAILPPRSFFPPSALLQYEQRLAWDYQRQLQEHFQAQAMLLRQMSMDPGIIPSEDGSEHGSRSSSTVGSDCCTPEIVDVDVQSASNEGNCDRERAEGDSAGNVKSIRSSKMPSSDTPLDALFQLSTKNFDEEQDPATLNIFATRPNPKKKRKSRTAFTNHQIFELEKRFLYQKYLSPADRDEIAAGLGLSNAQVITWFQNRRAKLKRDMEELKKDVESVKQLSAHKSFLENVNDLSILKTRPVSRHQQQQQQQPASTTSTAATTAPTLSATTTSAFSIISNNSSSSNDGDSNTTTSTTTATAQQQSRYNINNSRG